eukprot:GFYU01001202.1.p1 GENE.GFYU01001202.1~~GFYU01001202.1.p1  ORF type:complete len:213 (-),score=23.42 GFYU01001202.1:267-836(-)
MAPDEKPITFLDLPTDIVQHIIEKSVLNTLDFCRFRIVCKDFKEIITSIGREKLYSEGVRDPSDKDCLMVLLGRHKDLSVLECKDIYNVPIEVWIDTLSPKGAATGANNAERMLLAFQAYGNTMPKSDAFVVARRFHKTPVENWVCQDVHLQLRSERISSTLDFAIWKLHTQRAASTHSEQVAPLSVPR